VEINVQNITKIRTKALVLEQREQCLSRYLLMAIFISRDSYLCTLYISWMWEKGSTF